MTLTRHDEETKSQKRDERAREQDTTCKENKKEKKRISSENRFRMLNEAPTIFPLYNNQEKKSKEKIKHYNLSK